MMEPLRGTDVNPFGTCRPGSAGEELGLGSEGVS